MAANLQTNYLNSRMKNIATLTRKKKTNKLYFFSTLNDIYQTMMIKWTEQDNTQNQVEIRYHLNTNI